MTPSSCECPLGVARRQRAHTNGSMSFLRSECPHQVWDQNQTALVLQTGTLRRSELRPLKTLSMRANGSIWRAYQWTHPESHVRSTTRMGTACGNKRKNTPDREWVERISVKAWNFLSRGPQLEKGVAWGIICRYREREQPISTRVSQLIPKDRVNPGTLYTSLG